MGAGSIIESSIKKTTDSIWSKVPAIPQTGLLNFELSNYNRSFVNFAIICGIVALTKTTIDIKNQIVHQLTDTSNKMPTKKELNDRYGYHSYVLITDVDFNEQYWRVFAEKGFNLILMGSQENIENLSLFIQKWSGEITIETIVVDWKKVEIDLQFYEKLALKLQRYDISFMVLPKLKQTNDLIPTHIDDSQPFQHVYLLVRYFGGKLKHRSYRSCIIFPSFKDIEQITVNNGITKSLIAGNDAFGRISSYELKGTVDIVIARGSVENAIKGMGKCKITY